MKQMIKTLFLSVLLLLCAAGCSAHEIDLYDENPPVLSEMVAQYYDSIGITDEVRNNAEAVYITYDLERPLQIRLPEYWESLFLIECESHDAAAMITLYDKYNHDYVDENNNTRLGRLWSVIIFTWDQFYAVMPADVSDISEVYGKIIGANNVILGEDQNYVYVLAYPIDMQCHENELAMHIYEDAQKYSVQIFEDFLTINHITKNKLAPKLN